MKTISAKRLEAAGACEDQVQLFRETFGDNLVRLTPENWAKAGEVGLDRLWLTRFLKGSARAGYDRMRGAAWAEYSRAVDAALAEYERAVTPALAEYNRAVTAARAEYNLVLGAALFAALTK